MPFPMQVILIVGATGYLLTALLFFIARTMPRTNPGAGWWGLSSLAAGTGYIALLVLGMSGRPELGEALYNTLFVVWIVSLYIGGSQFLYLKVNTKTLLSLAAVVVLWLSYFNHIQPEFLPAAVAVSLFCGLLNLHLAWLFATKMVRNSAIKKALVVALAISGLHWLDYPLLRPIESFAPIGFSLCAIISVAINSLLAGMLLRQFRHRMLEAEEMAVDSATHDLLTGLNNRMALNTLFDQVMAQARRNETEIAMLYLDLDGFKPVNDRLGHRAGDEVLIEVAKRITSVARESDVVARIGGDEFVVILTGLKGGERADAEPIAEKIVDVINLPMNIAGEGCRLSTSVGIAYCPSQAESLDKLLNLADKAMYVTKHGGKNGFTIAESA